MLAKSKLKMCTWNNTEYVERSSLISSLFCCVSLIFENNSCIVLYWSIPSYTDLQFQTIDQLMYHSLTLGLNYLCPINSYSLCIFKRTKYRKNSSAYLMLVYIPSWCIESKNKHYVKIQQALFEGRARLLRKLLPKGPYWLCYLAGSSKRARWI